MHQVSLRRLIVVLAAILATTGLTPVPAGAVEDAPWTATTGSGTVSVDASGVEGPVSVSYAATDTELFNSEDYRNTWEFRTVAETTGTVTSEVTVTGDHGDSGLRWDQRDADGLTILTNETLNGAFSLTQTMTWNVVAGQEYGFDLRVFNSENENFEPIPFSANGAVTLDAPSVLLNGGPGVGAEVPRGRQLADLINVDAAAGQRIEFVRYRAVLSPGLAYIPDSSSYFNFGSSSPVANPEMNPLPGDFTELVWSRFDPPFEAVDEVQTYLRFEYEVLEDADLGPASVVGSIDVQGATFESAPRNFTIVEAAGVLSSEVVPLEDPITADTPSPVVLVTRLESGAPAEYGTRTILVGNGLDVISVRSGSTTITDSLGSRPLPDPMVVEAGSLFYDITFTIPGGSPVETAQDSRIFFDLIVDDGTGNNVTFESGNMEEVDLVKPVLVSIPTPLPNDSFTVGDVFDVEIEVGFDGQLEDLDSITVNFSDELEYREDEVSNTISGPFGTAPFGSGDAGSNMVEFRNFTGLGQPLAAPGDPLVLTIQLAAIGGADAMSEAFIDVEVDPTDGALQQASVTVGVNDPPPVGGTTSLLQAVPLPAQNGNAQSVGLVASVLTAEPNVSGDVIFLHSEICEDGVLDEAGRPIGVQPVTTDANGELFFATAFPSDLTSGFVSAVFGTGAESPCIVLGPDNDSWTRALEVAPGSTTEGFIDAQGTARWFKFPIQPGAEATVTLNGLPANYDIAVFKDIGQAYDDLSNPEEDLHRLSAEFAPSVFSPSVFSPSVFSPSVFSPDAYAPSVFSPSVFSPSVFSPSVFSPSVFSPSVFSPSVFSPSVFSPSVFSPSVFSPSVFSPSVFSPSVFSPSVFSPSVFSPSVFSSAQTRSIIAVGANDGKAPEEVVANTWNNTGDFYVRVTGRNGAFDTENPFDLTVSLDGALCNTGALVQPGARPAIPGADVSTVIVWDPEQLEGSEAEKTALLLQMQALTARPEVNGVIIDLSEDGEVQQLKTIAEANPGCVYAANLWAESIKNIIDSYRNPNLQYVTLIGADDSVPFFRYPDQALLGPEQDYEPPVRDDSISQAALRLNYIMGQDEYGSRISVSQGDGDIPIPDLAVGRLVETAAEATGLIEAYIATDGVAPSQKSYTTGYDFLTDSATEVADILEAGTGFADDDSRLIAPADEPPEISWTASDLEAGLLGPDDHDLVFLAGHFSANSALAADYETSLITTQLAADSDTSFENAIVFSGGCHSGYNIPFNDIVPGVTLPLDWAQAFAQKRATLIAGTGYQYGDTDFVEYSERLYVEFSAALRDGTAGDAIAVGDAMNTAKQRYLETTPDVRGLHRKSLIIATVFGLPMIGVDMANRTGGTGTPTLAVSPTQVAEGPGSELGLRTEEIDVPGLDSLPERTVELDNLEVNLETGQADPAPIPAKYLEGEQGVVTNPAEPAIPLIQRRVEAGDGLVLRGVGFRSGSYTDDEGDQKVVPLTGAPTTELRGVHTPFGSPIFFPLRISTVNYFGELYGEDGDGGKTILNVTPVQHRVETIGDFEAIRRTYSELGLKLFYSNNTTEFDDGAIPALAAPPTISDVSAVIDGGDVVFEVTVFGDPSAGIQEVWVTYDAGDGQWISLDLTPSADDPTRFVGRLVGGADLGQLEFVVQAANGVGLVSLDDNLGSYFEIGEDEPVADAAPTTVTLTAPNSGTFGDSIAVSAVVRSGETPLEGQVVQFALGPVTRVVTTDGIGAASASLPLTSEAGTYPLTASYAGTANFEASGSSSSFQINRAPTSLTVTSVEGALEGLLDLEAILTRGEDQPINERTVFFTIEGNGETTTIAAITNFAGVAAVRGVELEPGEYTVTARFLGVIPGIGDKTDPVYSASSATSQLTIDGAPDPVGDTIVYLSSSSSGSVGGVTFDDEDVVSYNTATGEWELLFDGSEVGLATRDLDAVEVVVEGEEIIAINLSLSGPLTVPGLGEVDDSDIIAFIPTSLGENTAGSFSLVLDGSDVSLMSSAEDIDAIASAGNGDRLLSTIGGNTVPGEGNSVLTGRDEDLLRLGSEGTFALELDGSDIDLSGEDISGASIDNDTGQIFLATLNGYRVPGLIGDSDDIIAFTGTTGADTSGTFSVFLDGDNIGFGSEQIDALHIEVGAAPPPVGIADVGITAIADPDVLEASDVSVVGVDVTNNGPDVARNVVLISTIPDGLELVSVSDCAGGSDLPCGLGDIDPGQTVTIEVRLQATGDELGSIETTLAVASSTEDSDASNDSASVSILVGGAPTAVDDGPSTDSAPGDPFHVALGGEISGSLTANDEPGSPVGSIVTFGGGELSSSVDDAPAGSTVELEGGGSVEVSANGDFVVNAPVGFDGELFTFQYRLENPAGSSVATVTIFVGEREAPTAGDLIYVSSSTSGTVDGITFADEDVLVWDSATDSWEMFIDGSKIGLARTDVTAVQIEDNGDVLLSIAGSVSIEGVGRVDDSDVIRFIPTATGSDTAGTLSLEVDGSSVGLTTNAEQLDALARSTEGALLASIIGGGLVPDSEGGQLTLRDEDLFALEGDSWSMFLDGSDVQLGGDIAAASVENGDVFLSGLGRLNVPGLSARGDDILTFTGTNGSTTTGTFAMFWDGADHGFGSEQIDGLHVVIAP